MANIPEGAIAVDFKIGLHDGPLGYTLIAWTTFGSGKLAVTASATEEGKRFLLGMYKKLTGLETPYDELDRLAASDVPLGDCIRAIDGDAYDWLKGRD